MTAILESETTSIRQLAPPRLASSTGHHLHLISYHSRPQPGQADLPQPTPDATLRGIVPVKGMYPESSMGETNPTPALIRAPRQQPLFIVAPQHPHHHPYAPQYGQPGYVWPPSSVATPPYSTARLPTLSLTINPPTISFLPTLPRRRCATVPVDAEPFSATAANPQYVSRTYRFP
ncbi:hypothetical protein AUP68_09906 [Ilyonectria robusta]